MAITSTWGLLAFSEAVFRWAKSRNGCRGKHIRNRRPEKGCDEEADCTTEQKMFSSSDGFWQERMGCVNRSVLGGVGPGFDG